MSIFCRTASLGKSRKAWRRVVPLSAVMAAFLATGCNVTPNAGSKASFGLAGGAYHGQSAAKTPSNYKVGKAYQVAGRWYKPQEDPSYDQVGLASWYGPKFHGKRTANGEIFDMNAFSAAHPTLPMPTYARVTNLENGRSVVVRINDRGPFAHGRIIDLSKRTAEALGFRHNGSAMVRVQYVGRSPGHGEWQTTTVRQEEDSGAPTTIAALLERDEAAGATPLPAGRPDHLLPAAGPADIQHAWASGFAPVGHSERVANTFSLFD